MLSRRLASFASFVFLLLLCFAAVTARADTHPEWTRPLPPFRIADNLYYVGSEDLASYLITTPAGNILVNANLPSSPPQIRHAVEQLGFRWQDIKILLNSQAHFDHAGGSAQILRETGARSFVMQPDADVLRTGGRSDFLASTGSVPPFPPARVDRLLHDGDTVSLGGTTLTAHLTAGHTRGCTTWTFRTHLPGEPANRLRDVVIVGGYSFWSDYHFVPTPAHPESYPGIAADFTRTFALYRILPCDIFLADHGTHFGLLEKLRRMSTEGPKVWIDPEGYRRTLAEAQSRFETELNRERTATP